MLRDLLDGLRCPHLHEESWLVAMVHEANGPELISADLACPVCGQEFLVRGGVAHFGDAPVPATNTADDEPDALRVAALLGAADGALPVLLAGHYARAGRRLADLTALAQVWINSHPDVHTVPGCSPIALPPDVVLLPLGVATLSAAALDAEHTDPRFLASVVRAVKTGGRLVAPVQTPLPEGVKELARDATEWVAEVTAHASGLIELRRRAPDQVG